jgi:hypothetical protein
MDPHSAFRGSQAYFSAAIRKLYVERLVSTVTWVTFLESRDTSYAATLAEGQLTEQVRTTRMREVAIRSDG